jgi:hypothetical protein
MDKQMIDSDESLDPGMDVDSSLEMPEHIENRERAVYYVIYCHGETLSSTAFVIPHCFDGRSFKLAYSACNGILLWTSATDVLKVCNADDVPAQVSYSGHTVNEMNLQGEPGRFMGIYKCIKEGDVGTGVCILEMNDRLIQITLTMAIEIILNHHHTNHPLDKLRRITVNACRGLHIFASLPPHLQPVQPMDTFEEKDLSDVFSGLSLGEKSLGKKGGNTRRRRRSSRRRSSRGRSSRRRRCSKKTKK